MSAPALFFLPPSSEDGPLLPAKQVPVTHQEIAQLAHRLWEARGAPLGSPEQDWFDAERWLLGPIPAVGT